MKSKRVMEAGYLSVCDTGSNSTGSTSEENMKTLFQINRTSTTHVKVWLYSDASDIDTAKIISNVRSALNFQGEFIVVREGPSDCWDEEAYPILRSLSCEVYGKECPDYILIYCGPPLLDNEGNFDAELNDALGTLSMAGIAVWEYCSATPGNSQYRLERVYEKLS